MNAKEFVKLARQSIPNLPDANTLALLNDESFRAEVCDEINKSVSASDRELSRHILKLDTASHQGDWGMSDDMRLSAFLLFKIANVEDSLLIWQAKESNFDTFCGLDIQLTVGAGIDETITYLKSLSDESALAAATYIEECRNAGDFKNLDKYAEEWDKYFGNQRAG